MKRIFIFGVAFTLMGCAARLPTNGTVTVFDGYWKGKFLSPTVACSGGKTNFEVRYGHYYGNVIVNGSRTSTFSGLITSEGKLVSNRNSGMSNADSDITFSADRATGTWKRGSCTGTVDFEKIS